jgi:hypothetical protein
MIRIEVRAAVPYAVIAEHATAAMKRRPILVDEGLVRGQVRVEDVRVEPSGAQLTVTVRFVADLAWPLPRVRGSVRLTGTPVFDEGAQSLRLRDVAFAGDVDHFLARAALAVKRRSIVDTLTGRSLDLGPILGTLRARINTVMDGHRPVTDVAVDGAVDVLRVDDIVVAEDLIVVASAAGRLRVVLDSPPEEPAPPAA